MQRARQLEGERQAQLEQARQEQARIREAGEASRQELAEARASIQALEAEQRQEKERLQQEREAFERQQGLVRQAQADADRESLAERHQQERAAADEQARLELADAKRQAVAIQEQQRIVLEEARQERERLARENERVAGERKRLARLEEERQRGLEREREEALEGVRLEKVRLKEQADLLAARARKQAADDKATAARPRNAEPAQQCAAAGGRGPAPLRPPSDPKGQGQGQDKLRKQRDFLTDARARAKARVDELTRKETGFRTRMSQSRPLPIPRAVANPRSSESSSGALGSKPLLPPKPEGSGDSRWQELVRRQRAKLQSLRHVDQLVVPVDGLLQRASPDAAGAAEGWTRAELAEQQTRRARAFEQMMAAQHQNLRKSAADADACKLRVLEDISKAARQKLGRGLLAPLEYLDDVLGRCGATDVVGLTVELRQRVVEMVLREHSDLEDCARVSSDLAALGTCAAA